ncbi:putative phospholipase B-like 2 isoform X2 [Dreissena polymorpha]|uniref:putative phospholipase B-like 2 isoform X2 n=1 Tax=Dreissena polymorpha TaxID=45954 RepID=UPI0022643BF9|nr:putative phospholipase B-like 2 isoform X2 [Dreissena polymorpha]XP_052256064.1 putative phospholipase B-like 2 isoform X2 [Dreissena polymorpha]
MACIPMKTSPMLQEWWKAISPRTTLPWPGKTQWKASSVNQFSKNKAHNIHVFNSATGQFCERPLNPECEQLGNFLQQNLEWMQDQIKSQDSDYWKMVELFLIQVRGLTDGYFNHPTMPSTDIDPFGLYVLSMGDDMEDIPNAMKPKVTGSGSCSALIKLLPGYKDLYVSQDTWSTYQSMLRMLKKYDFAFQTGAGVVPGQVMTFSSYPGSLLSGDDYYLISSGLASLETTIGNNNPALYKYVTYNTVFEGIRTMVANRLATTGMEWGKTFAMFNSGTYNNQWMVVDYKVFMPGFSPKTGLLMVLEQIPGTVIYDDQTDLLVRQSYWPSYNIAFYPEIFNKSGCWDNVQKYGDWFTYDKSPRAQIFKRDNGKVTDLASMQKLMRYNDFQHDPLARCNCTPPYSAENAISARCDLNPADGTYPFGALGHRSHGGTDMKLTNLDMFQRLEFIAVSGPTWDQLPPFQWSKADFAAACPHNGHPDVFKFDPIKFNGTFSGQ